MLYVNNSKQMEYIIEFKLIDDNILITIKENNKFVPYTYEALFSHEDFIEHHRAFKSCVNVKEILMHLSNLYDNEKIIIDDDDHNNCRYMTFKILYICLEENTSPFELERKMVEDKNKALIELYEEQKRQIKKIKQIEQLINASKNINNNELLRKNILYILSNEDIFIFRDDYL